MIKNSFKAFAAMACAVGVLSSCDSNEDGEKLPVKTVDFQFEQSAFKPANGEWIHAYDASWDNALAVDGFIFGRTATATEWGGVTYYSWKGFTPSMSYDAAEYPGNWVEHQWSTMAAGTPGGNGFMLACWDSAEDTTGVPANPSVCVTSNDGSFIPLSVVVANASYTYWVVKQGDDFCKKFTADDVLKLIVVGECSGVETGRVEVQLAHGQDVPTGWMTVDVSSLGVVEKMYFQMASTDSGQWGMNTPGYFCLGQIKVEDLPLCTK